MHFTKHRATMQHAARYVKQCENRLRYAKLHKRGDDEQAMHAANLQRAIKAQAQVRRTKLSEVL